MSIFSKLKFPAGLLLLPLCSFFYLFQMHALFLVWSLQYTHLVLSFFPPFEDIFDIIILIINGHEAARFLVQSTTLMVINSTSNSPENSQRESGRCVFFLLHSEGTMHENNNKQNVFWGINAEILVTLKRFVQLKNLLTNPPYEEVFSSYSLLETTKEKSLESENSKEPQFCFEWVCGLLMHHRRSNSK